MTMYTYEAHFNWKWHKDFAFFEIPTRETVEAQLRADFETAFLAEFAAKIAAAGHWYKMDRVETSITKYSGTWGFPFPLPPFYIDVEGTTTIFFETDVQDATAHNSPQLWQVVKDCIYSVIHWLELHPSVLVVLLAAGFLTILTVWLINTYTGAVQKIGEDIGATVITVGIIVVVGVVAYLYFGSKGSKRRKRSKK